MKATGERLVTTQRGKNVWEHLHRYHIAGSFAKNKDVLDIASGEGYGSNILSCEARSVIGVDISHEAVAHASATYTSANLRFLQGECLSIPLPDSSVDLVVSYETIEHIKEHDQFIAEIKRVSRRDGVVIISTPNKKVYSEVSGHVNPFHIKELYIEEFRTLLNSHFSFVYFLYQITLEGSLIIPENTASLEPAALKGNFYRSVNSKLTEEAEYVVAICGSHPISGATITTFTWNEATSFSSPNKNEAPPKKFTFFERLRRILSASCL